MSYGTEGQETILSSGDGSSQAAMNTGPCNRVQVPGFRDRAIERGGAWHSCVPPRDVNRRPGDIRWI